MSTTEIMRAMTATLATEAVAGEAVVKGPSYYRGKSGLQSIEITESYRLGPHLTQAVDYLLRAGRKTPDPRQDLAKAAWYCRRAAERRVDLVFGAPFVLGSVVLARLDGGLPTVSHIAAEFGLCGYRALALAELLTPHPKPERLLVAAGLIDRVAEKWTRDGLPAANRGSAA